jgi:acyl-CoA thioesterase-1
LTSGFGLAHPAEESFVALIQKKIAAAGLPWRVINAGISGNFTSDGLRRIGPAMQDGPPAVLVLELGANDGLRRLPVVQTQANLQAIIDAARSKNPAVKIVLAGMKLPTSYGGYADNFAAIYPALARSNQTILIPFLLEGVGGVPALNQPDGIHPTASGHTKVAEIVWLWLRPLLSQ